MNKIVYRVNKLTSLEQIAEKFHTTPHAISRLNNLDRDVFVGMRLLVEPCEGEYYVVQPFDTITSIAKKFCVGEDVIKEFNSDRIFLGQRLFIRR
ncbi:MAG: LysM peptidoglycan-binding domain-containing protein [Clostridia bacterium]|nr:LysM peptidoglycan-binding domain-containing protein [Clostridia bacterium]MDE6613940.1 LysM peptidoglycan-binding domain-containing protein [Clostridia bacterium]